MLGFLRRLSWLVPPGSWAAAIIAICTCLEWIALSLMPTSILRPDEQGVPRVILLATIPLLFWWTAVWIVYWYLQILCRVWKAESPLHRRCRAIAATIPAGLVCALYLLSWGFCLRTGLFPDSDVFRFALLNSTMLSKYFWQTEPHVLVQLMLLGTICGICCYFLIARTTNISTKTPTRQGVGPLFIAACTLTNLVIVPATIEINQTISPAERRSASYLNAGRSLAYDLTKRVNPVVTWLSAYIPSENAANSESIPLDRLPPRSIQSVSMPVPQTQSSLQERPPNVLIIVIESLRADVIDAVHQNQQVVPHINQLGRQGTTFTHAYAQSVHSDYSDPCIASSLYPLRTSGQYFYQRAVPWPKVLLWDGLKPRGYATAMFSSQNEAWSNMHLFYDSPALDVLFDARSAAAEASLPEGDDDFKKWAAETGLAGKLDDRVTCKSALRWIARQESTDTPWQVLLNFQTSHFPYQLPAGQQGPFQPCTLNFKKSLFDWDPQHAGIVRNAYFNALHFIDAQVGQVVEHLRQLNALDRTIIVVTGDHGEAFGETTEVGHAQSLLETVARVPLIFHCSGRVPAQRTDYLGQAIDIAPTILGLVGQPIPDAFQGVDLLSPARQPAEERLVFLHSRAGGRGADAVVAASGWKLTYDYDQGRYELFLRPTDLQVARNFARESPEITDLLASKLSEWRRWQLAYYGQSRYHQIFYAPRNPTLTTEEAKMLSKAASTITTEQ